MYRGATCAAGVVNGVTYNCAAVTIGLPINTLGVNTFVTEWDQNNTDKDLQPGNPYGISVGLFYNPANSFIPSANFTGSISGTTLTVPTGGVTYYQLTPNAVISGSGVSSGTTIVKQLTSTEGSGWNRGAIWGGGGTYQVSISQTIGSEAMTMGPSSFSNTSMIFASNSSGSVAPASITAKTGNVGNGTVVMATTELAPSGWTGIGRTYERVAG
jgi:hypothetical protein